MITMSSGCGAFVRPTHGLPLETARSRGFEFNGVTKGQVRACLSRRTFLIASSGIGAAYDKWASNYEMLDGRTKLTNSLGLSEARRVLCSKARGDVLEVGVGTGVNLPLYNATSVKTLTCVDASIGMLDEARSAASTVGAQLVQARAESLPFADNSFDTVLDTFSLCTFTEPLSALRECKRVLRSGETSRLLLLEHTASDNAILRAYQDVTSTAVSSLSKGCVWNQRVEELVREAGFNVVSMEKMLGGTVVRLEVRKA